MVGTGRHREQVSPALVQPQCHSVGGSDTRLAAALCH